MSAQLHLGGSFCGGSDGGSFVFLASNKGSSSISGFDATGATFLAVTLTVFSGGGDPATGDITDNLGNTYTLAVTRSSNVVAIFYCVSPDVSSPLTITYSQGGTVAPSIAVMAFSGPNATLTATNSGSGNAPGSATGTLLIAMESNNQSTQSGVTVDSGFTIAEAQDYSLNIHYGTTSAYLIQVSSAAQSPTFTSGGSADYGSAIAAFD